MKELARGNRKNPTEAESIMWDILRNCSLGVRFRRQQVIAGYIADFACLTKKLIIEIDGEYHFTEEQIQKDRFRTDVFKTIGFTELRFTNDEVLFDTDNVIKKIKNFLIKELQ